jgi:hypothetical protein
VSPLAAELLRILEAEAGHPPLSADSLHRVIKAIGYGDGQVDVVQVEAACAALLQDGQIEVLHRFGEARFRVPLALRAPAPPQRESG